jgi:VCBS repeat-containing protein
MLNITLNYDAQALAAVQSFRDGMEAAVLMLERHVLDDINVNIAVGYGEINGNPVSTNISVGGPGATANGAGFDLTYTALRAALASHNTSATDQTVLDNLANASSIEGQSNFRIGNAQARALGLVNATDGTVDGAVGMGTGFTGDVLFAGAIHELTHAMGRVANWLNVNWSVDLFRWNEDLSGNRVFGGNLPPPNATASYLSIDGGTTKLADFGVASDPGDFLNGGVQGTDPFNETVGGRGITIIGLLFLDALGFHVGNQAPTVAALTNTINEDAPFSRDLLSGSSDFETDTISVASLSNSVATTGGRVLSLGTDYTLSGSTMALTAAGIAKFNNLGLGQSDTAVFQFNVTDFLNASTPNKLTLSIDGLNDAPVAHADFGSAGENEIRSFGVLSNDTDVDLGDTKSLISIGTVSTSSANPVIDAILAAGAFLIDGDQIKFSPGTLFDALDHDDTASVVVNYTMQDNHLATSSSTLTLTVEGANDAPVAKTDTGSATENETKSFDVLANDTDVDYGDTKDLVSVDGVTVSSINPVINGINAASAFSVDGNKIKFLPGTLFDSLAVGDTATVKIDYTMEDSQNAASSSTLTLTVIGENDPPVITSGGGGDTATYFVRVTNSKITTVISSDVDYGDVDTFSIVGGADASLFSIDTNTGALAFKSLPQQPHNNYAVQVQASDGKGGTDIQAISVNVTAAKMVATADADTFVFHGKFGANEVSGFDIDHDFLQFDHGMFANDTAAAVLAVAQDDHKGNLIVDAKAGHLVLDGVTLAQLQAHSSDIFFA